MGLTRINDTDYSSENATAPASTNNGTNLDWSSWTSDTGFDVKILYIPIAILGFTGNCLVLIG